MAIKKLTETEEALNIEINNGDLGALNEIIINWGFKDKESALRFAIAVLKVTKPGKLSQETPDGNKSLLIPTENLTGKVD